MKFPPGAGEMTVISTMIIPDDSITFSRIHACRNCPRESWLGVCPPTQANESVCGRKIPEKMKSKSFQKNDI